MPHNLNYHNTAVCRGSVAKFINCVNGSICSGVAANSIVSPPNVVINGAGETDNRNTAFFREHGTTGQGAVAANDDKSLNAALVEILKPLLAALNRLELFTASSAEERAAALNQITDAATIKLNNLICQHTFITVINAINFDTFVESSTNDSTSRCIHAGAVTAGSHYRYRLLDHKFTSCLFHH